MSKPKILPTAPGDSPSPEAIASIAEALTAGHPVVLPTETVYGLAVRADNSEALKVALGQRHGPTGAPWTLHLAGPEGIAEAAELTRPVARLLERYSPGPLTLVLQPRKGEAATSLASKLRALHQDDWCGVRVPSHPATAAVLKAVDGPVAIVALANAEGTFATDVQAAAAAAEGSGAEWALDGGAASLGQPSTVLALGPGRFEVLRKGIIERETLSAVAGQRLLFVCTGNTCRSPMAEALARHSLRRALGTDDETRFGFAVASAGVYAGPGAPPSENSVAAMADRGIDLSGHRSSPVIDRQLQGFDRVYCLTASHREALLSVLPPGSGERIELIDPEGRDVPDPYGGPLEVYRATADVIESFIRRRLEEWV